VLGSTQDDQLADRPGLDAAGIDLVRRRSGGGAVLVHPDEVCLWVDVVLPRRDPLWTDDVSRAAQWLGEAWVDAFASLGVSTLAHRGAMVHRPWSDLVCFAGLGPGEVLDDGRKVVGLSQRRTRAGARFQTLVLRRWSPGALVDLLALDPPAREAATRELESVATGTDLPPAALLDAFVASLPTT
jgi:lipoate-protein ligase A